MRLLAFSTYFWPEETGPAPYVTEPLRYLAGRGHQVEVWTGFAHYPAWAPMQPRSLFRVDELDGMVVHRRVHYVPRSQSAARRGLYEASLTLGALTGVVQARRPDVVLGVTPTLSGAVVGAAAAARFGVPYALLVHDLMGKAAEQSGVAGGQRVAAAVQPLEHAAARRANRIGIIADGFRAYFNEAGVPDDRIVRLRTWTLGHNGNQSKQAVRARLGWGDSEFVVLHAGNMGHKQGLQNLIDSAALLRHDPGVRVVLAGDGNDRTNLERHAAALGLENLQFIGPQPWGEYEGMLKAADVLLVNQRGTVGDMSLPSKLTSYFAAGRPTVAAVAPGSETAREVRISGGGLVVGADDPPALAVAVRALRDDPARQKALGLKAKRYAEQRLSAEAVLPEYEAFLDGIARGPKRSIATAVLDRTPGPIARAIANNKHLKSALRPLANRVSPAGETEVTVRDGHARGLRMVIEPQLEKYYWTGGHEPHLQNALAEELTRGATFWDVGAHIGFFTLQAARIVGPEGTVVAFEPMPENRRRLSRNLELNGFTATVVAEAVSDKTGRMPIYESHGSSLMWTLDEQAGAEPHSTVEVGTLDSHLAMRGLPDLVKIDAENFEVAVLRGAENLLGRRSTSFLIEFPTAALLDEGRVLLDRYRLTPLGANHWLAQP